MAAMAACNGYAVDLIFAGCGGSDFICRGNVSWLW